MKNYLVAEDERNERNTYTYERLLRLALGAGTLVVVGHHVSFKLPLENGTMSSLNEIPSADTVMFCHELMEKAFGKLYLYQLARLATRPVEERDALLEEMVTAEEDRRRENAQSVQTNPCISGS